MKTIILFFIFLSLFLTSCTNLWLGEDNELNERTVRNYIPIGTDKSEAITKMENAGFKCEISRGKKAQLYKGNVDIGVSPPMDFIWCDKEGFGIIIIRRWQVILILDESDKVKDVSVSTGLIGL